MKNMLEYKDFIGSVVYSSKDNILFGKVIGINSLISYEGDSIKSLRDDFQEAIDNYLDICEETKILPEKSYKGSFNVRVSPILHKELVLLSSSRGVSLNSVVCEAIDVYVSKANNS